MTAWPLTLLMPINKKIWSISYTFLTCGISAVSLSFITLTCDVAPRLHAGYKRIFLILSQPLIWLGRNPLAIFMSRDLLDDIMNSYIHIGGKTMWDQIYHYLFESWISSPPLACMAQATFYWLILTF